MIGALIMIILYLITDNNNKYLRFIKFENSQPIHCINASKKLLYEQYFHGHTSSYPMSTLSMEEEFRRTLFGFKLISHNK